MFAMPGGLVLDATYGTASLELAAIESQAPKNLEFVAFERNFVIPGTTHHYSLNKSCTRPTFRWT